MATDDEDSDGSVEEPSKESPFPGPAYTMYVKNTFIEVSDNADELCSLGGHSAPELRLSGDSACMASSDDERRTPKHYVPNGCVDANLQKHKDPDEKTGTGSVDCVSTDIKRNEEQIENTEAKDFVTESIAQEDTTDKQQATLEVIRMMLH